MTCSPLLLADAYCWRETSSALGWKSVVNLIEQVSFVLSVAFLLLCTLYDILS